MVKWTWAIAIATVGAIPSARSTHAQTCEDLAKLTRAGVTITSATPIPAGGFKPASGPVTVSNLPPFCRVEVRSMPTSDSEIGIEVWLPLKEWNGKFLAVGSGGWGGSFAYGAMAEALARGYATSATDDGHRGASASFIVGHPEKFKDFAYRSEHEMAVEAKILIREFYHRSARYSYWDGCSGGGREGLLQAARYPDEFDGIIAGDPANVRRNGWALWLANQTFKDPADYIPKEKYPLIHAAVLEACDANDGVKDGLIENPEICKPDFTMLRCTGPDRADCLTPRQVSTAQIMLSPAKDKEGRVFFPGLEPGTELRWDRLAGGPEPADLFLDEFRYVIYQDPKWDWRSFDLDRDAAKANAIDKNVDELDPHLGVFRMHHGKLLLYHGWADQQVAPGSTIEFYKSAVDSSGAAATSQEWIRLFMVPGMGHCSGGEGPDSFDKIGILERWVENGEAPDEITASHRKDGKVDRTRPLCPYPRVAHYKGKGSIDEAGSFKCE